MYLTKDNNNLFVTRELIPEKSGFKAPARRPGDSFGSAVLTLPYGNTGLRRQSSIRAPGDAKGKRAVYLLTLSGNGRVMKSEKVAADTPDILAKQQNRKTGFGSALTTSGDMNKTGILKLVVKSLSGPLPYCSWFRLATCVLLCRSRSLLSREQCNPSMAKLLPRNLVSRVPLQQFVRPVLQIAFSMKRVVLVD